MKILLSLNQKFFINDAHFFIQKIKAFDEFNSVSGFEVSFDFTNPNHLKFINDLVNYCEKDNYYLQFHGNSTYELDLQYEYLNYLNEIAKTLEYRVNVVFHPIKSINIIDSLKETNIYFSNILNYIYDNQLNINISIENLTSRNKNILSKEVLLPILANNSDLNYTYDLGHEIFEFGNITDLNPLLIKRLINIHTFDYNFDHLPILKDSKNKEKWLKGLLYLKSINYNGPIVLEYDFYKLGIEYEERLQNYVNSAYFIKDYLKKKV